MRARSASVSELFPRSPTFEQPPRKRILVVEDDCVSNLFVQSLLRAFGVEREDVDHAVNADEALAFAADRKGQYCFILMDLCLKDSVSGFEIMNSIRVFDAETPMVVVSAMTDTVSLTKAMQAGARGFLPKPVTASGIQELLLTFAFPVQTVPKPIFDPCVFRETSPRYVDKTDPLEVLCAMNDIPATSAFVKSALYNLHNALTLAAKRGFSEICSNLLKLMAERENLGAPLHAAIVEGHAHIVQLLLSTGVPVNWACKETQNTALHVCCRQSNVSLCNILIQCKANVNAMSLNGYTPLHVAAWSGSLECVKLLIARGGDVHVMVRLLFDFFLLLTVCKKKSKNGFGVIDVTTDLEIVAFLLSRGCKMRSVPDRPKGRQRVPRERSVTCTPRQKLMKRN
jgi:CheY-like chemotaxis protein